MERKGLTMSTPHQTPFDTPFRPLLVFTEFSAKSTMEIAWHMTAERLLYAFDQSTGYYLSWYRYWHLLLSFAKNNL